MRYWNDNGQWCWNLVWRREWFDWEFHMVTNFTNKPNEVKVVKGNYDSRPLLDNATGQYSVNSAYTLINNLKTGPSTVEIFRKIWQLNIPQGSGGYLENAIEEDPNQGQFKKKTCYCGEGKLFVCIL